MVRIFVWTFIIFNTCAKKIASDYKIVIKTDNKELAKAELKDLILDINLKYPTKAKISKITAFSNNFILAENIQTQIQIEEDELTLKTQETFIVQDENDYFLEASLPTQLKYKGWKITSNKITANTLTRIAKLHKCKGNYNDFQFHTKKNVILTESNSYAKQIIANNSKWDILIDAIEFNTNQSLLTNINIASKDKNVQIEIGNANLTAKENTMNEIKLNFTTKKNEKIEIHTNIAQLEDENTILFPNTIYIKIAQLELIAESGKKIDDKIMLKNISLKNNKTKAISREACVDLTSKTFFLEEGRIIW